jgi:hypothetical protein
MQLSHWQAGRMASPRAYCQSLTHVAATALLALFSSVASSSSSSPDLLSLVNGHLDAVRLESEFSSSSAAAVSVSKPWRGMLAWKLFLLRRSADHHSQLLPLLSAMAKVTTSVLQAATKPIWTNGQSDPQTYILCQNEKREIAIVRERMFWA